MTNLETIRRTRKLQQQELADSAGVPQATISRAENGKGTPLRSAMKIARALALSVEEVFGDVDIDDAPELDPTLRATDEPSSADSSSRTHAERPSHAPGGAVMRTVLTVVGVAALLTFCAVACVATGFMSAGSV